MPMGLPGKTRTVRTRTRKTRSVPFYAFLALVLGFLVNSTLMEPRKVEFTTHEVPVRGLPKEFDGFTIVQMSDLHAGIFARPYGFRNMVKRVNALQPDIVALTGDYVSRFPVQIELMGKALSELKATHGVYAVLGNHDYWVDADRVTKALKDNRFEVLFNEKRKVSIGDRSIWLLGLDDTWEGDTDYLKAFEGISPDQVCVALAHNPDAVTRIRGEHVALLMAGHTHGGMVNLPWFGPLFSVTHLGPKYSSGMFHFGEIRMYISRGMGSGTPLRFRCRPEVPVFILRSVE